VQSAAGDAPLPGCATGSYYQSEPRSSREPGTLRINLSSVADVFNLLRILPDCKATRTSTIDV